MAMKSLLQIRVVESQDGAVFQDLYNRTAEELSQYDPEIRIEQKPSGHCAYFMYRVHIQEQMNLKEAFKQFGYAHKCIECPALEVGADARRKTWGCKYSPYGESRVDADMCDYMYNLLAQGKVLLNREGKEGVIDEE